MMYYHHGLEFKLGTSVLGVHMHAQRQHQFFDYRFLSELLNNKRKCITTSLDVGLSNKHKCIFQSNIL